MRIWGLLIIKNHPDRGFGGSDLRISRITGTSKHISGTITSQLEQIDAQRYGSLEYRSHTSEGQVSGLTKPIHRSMTVFHGICHAYNVIAQAGAQC